MSDRPASSFVSLTALCAVVLFSVLLFAVRDESAERQIPVTVTEIAVGHDAAATLTVSLSVGKGDGIAEFTNEGGGTISLDLPVSWKRREVRGAALDDVTEESKDAMHTRWRIPSGVTVSYWIGGSPALSVRNASATPLLVLAKRVNVVSGHVEEKSVLVQKGVIEIW